MKEVGVLKHINQICEREKVLDGDCKNLIIFGKVTRELLERWGIFQQCGLHGKTRIVIEFNNDTGEGWRRITAEDQVTVSIHKHRLEGHIDESFDPIRCNR